ncbi:MAG: insulinase family protein [Candidatus Zixiibacteriota bacterium]|nr:MAG: insulinase family protein [candidate division Zixibacteria bacterium]
MKSRIVIFLLLLISINVPALCDEITMPPVTEKILPNGLELLLVENHELPIAYMKMVVASGSMRDPGGKEGLAGFTANMLKRGTGSRTKNAIAEEIDFIGGKMKISVNRDAVEITVELLTRHMDVGISILSDMMLNPVFDSTEIEKYKKQVLNAIIQSKENPYLVCSENFNKLLFGNHPYAHPVRGSKESVERITRDDITVFYGDYIRPNNSFLIVAGDIDPDVILPALETAFGSWKREEIPPLSITTPPVPDGRRILLIDKPDATQSHITFGTIGITRQSEYYYPFQVMNYVLGAGVSFVNRLMTEVRVKGGLTYDIRTTNDFNILPGGFYCSTSTENDSTLKAIEMALAVMKDMAENEVTDEEYNQAIGFYSGYYPISLETPEQWADEISKIKLYGLPDNYIKDFVKNIGAVKKEDILKVAGYLIDTDNMVFCVVTNAADVKSDLEKLGRVTAVNLDDL